MTSMEGGSARLQYLLFVSGAQTYALELGAVSEIVAPRTVVPVPLVPEYVEGMMNLRGRIVTLVSLPRLLGHPGEEGSAGAMVILSGSGDGLAFGVEELAGIREVGAGLLDELAVGEGMTADGVKAVLQIEGQPVSLLDPERLVSAVSDGAARPGAAG